MTTNAFGMTTDDFDLDAWLDQGSRPQQTVKVYRDWSLFGELADLEAKIGAASEDEDPAMGDDSVEELREQYEAVLERLTSSAMEVTMRALTNEEVRDVAAGVPEVEHKFTDQHGKEQTRLKPDQLAVGDALVAEATVSPKLSRDQVKKLRQTLGDGPTLVLYETATNLRTAGKVLPGIPFSRESSDDSPA